MARKAKKRPSRPVRPVAPSGPAPAATPARAATAGAAQAVRSLEMTLAPRPAQRGPRGRIVLESADPGIPHQHVPYFGADLRRLGLVGGAMIVLLVIGSRLIPLIVK